MTRAERTAGSDRGFSFERCAFTSCSASIDSRAVVLMMTTADTQVWSDPLIGKADSISNTDESIWAFSVHSDLAICLTCLGSYLALLLYRRILYKRTRAAALAVSAENG
eukprot:scaffold201218_cov17-Prasinocladus_malaysianus.AAC.1